MTHGSFRKGNHRLHIRNVTEAVLRGDLDFDKMDTLSDEEVICTLTKLHGIGNWTAKMFLIFVLNCPDVLPVEDGAFLRTYRWVYKTDDCSEKAVSKKCRKWKPYEYRDFQLSISTL